MSGGGAIKHEFSYPFTEKTLGLEVQAIEVEGSSVGFEVLNVSKQSQCANHVRKGDVVVALNKRDVRKMEAKDFFKLISATKRPLTLKFSRQSDPVLSSSQTSNKQDLLADAARAARKLKKRQEEREAQEKFKFEEERKAAEKRRLEEVRKAAEKRKVQEEKQKEADAKRLAKEKKKREIDSLEAARQTEILKEQLKLQQKRRKLEKTRIEEANEARAKEQLEKESSFPQKCRPPSHTISKEELNVSKREGGKRKSCLLNSYKKRRSLHRVHFPTAMENEDAVNARRISWAHKPESLKDMIDRAKARGVPMRVEFRPPKKTSTAEVIVAHKARVGMKETDADGMIENELDLEIGQVLTIMQKCGDRWSGRCGDRSGWFPSSCVKEIVALDDSYDEEDLRVVVEDQWRRPTRNLGVRKSYLEERQEEFFFSMTKSRGKYVYIAAPAGKGNGSAFCSVCGCPESDSCKCIPRMNNARIFGPEFLRVENVCITPCWQSAPLL